MNEKIMRMHYETKPKEILIDILVSARGSMTFWYRQIYDYLQELKGDELNGIKK